MLVEYVKYFTNSVAPFIWDHESKQGAKRWKHFQGTSLHKIMEPLSIDRKRKIDVYVCVGREGWGSKM